MTRPAYTVKYMQTSFKKYQILAIACTTLTVVAALFAALSGIQVNALKKNQEAAMASNTANQQQREEASNHLIETLKQQLVASQEQLIVEKQNVKNLIGKVADMEKQLSVTEAKLLMIQQKTMPPSPTKDTPAEDEAAPPTGTGNGSDEGVTDEGAPSE